MVVVSPSSEQHHRTDASSEDTLLLLPPHEHEALCQKIAAKYKALGLAGATRTLSLDLAMALFHSREKLLLYYFTSTSSPLGQFCKKVYQTAFETTPTDGQLRCLMWEVALDLEFGLDELLDYRAPSQHVKQLHQSNPTVSLPSTTSSSTTTNESSSSDDTPLLLPLHRHETICQSTAEKYKIYGLEDATWMLSIQLAGAFVMHRVKFRLCAYDSISSPVSQYFKQVYQSVFETTPTEAQLRDLLCRVAKQLDESRWGTFTHHRASSQRSNPSSSSSSPSSSPSSTSSSTTTTGDQINLQTSATAAEEAAASSSSASPTSQNAPETTSSLESRPARRPPASVPTEPWMQDTLVQLTYEELQRIRRLHSRHKSKGTTLRLKAAKKAYRRAKAQALVKLQLLEIGDDAHDTPLNHGNAAATTTTTNEEQPHQTNAATTPEEEAAATAAAMVFNFLWSRHQERPSGVPPRHA